MLLHVDFCFQQSKDAGIRTLVMLDEQGGNVISYFTCLYKHFPYIVSFNDSSNLSKIHCIVEITLTLFLMISNRT